MGQGERVHTWWYGRHPQPSRWKEAQPGITWATVPRLNQHQHRMSQIKMAVNWRMVINRVLIIYLLMIAIFLMCQKIRQRGDTHCRDRWKGQWTWQVPSRHRPRHSGVKPDKYDATTQLCKHAPQPNSKLLKTGIERNEQRMELLRYGIKLGEDSSHTRVRCFHFHHKCCEGSACLSTGSLLVSSWGFERAVEQN